MSEAYCSSWIFANMFNVAEIILAAKIISDVVKCEIKHWNDFKIILFHM